MQLITSPNLHTRLHLSTVMPGVSITIKSPATGLERSVTTGSGDSGSSRQVQFAAKFLF